MKTDGVIWGNLLILDLHHIPIKKVILPLIEQIFYDFWLAIKNIASQNYIFLGSFGCG